MDGSGLGAMLWQSPTVSGIGSGANGAGVFDFSPTGVNLQDGHTYVAFLSTFGIAGNSGLATVGACLSFSQCTSVDPRLGNLVTANVFPDGTTTWSNANFAFDATFSGDGLRRPRAFHLGDDDPRLLWRRFSRLSTPEWGRSRLILGAGLSNTTERPPWWRSFLFWLVNCVADLAGAHSQRRLAARSALVGQW